MRSAEAPSWEGSSRRILIDLMCIKAMLALVITGVAALLVKAFS